MVHKRTECLDAQAYIDGWVQLTYNPGNNNRNITPTRNWTIIWFELSYRTPAMLSTVIRKHAHTAAVGSRGNPAANLMTIDIGRIR